MAKKTDKIKRTGGLNPDAPFFKKCIAPINEDEFLFYAQMAISAGQVEMPLKKRPTDYGFNLVDDKTGGVSSYHFTDNPINRMMAALVQNLDDKERQEKMPAISTRVLALMDLFSSGKLQKWIKKDPTSKQHAFLPAALFRAAAKAPINTELQFNWSDFEQLVDKLIVVESDSK